MVNGVSRRSKFSLARSTKHTEAKRWEEARSKVYVGKEEEASDQKAKACTVGSGGSSKTKSTKMTLV
jgi:hypothetical protein